MPSTAGTLGGIFVDPAGIFRDGDNATRLALCPACKSAFPRDKFPRFSHAKGSP